MKRTRTSPWRQRLAALSVGVVLSLLVVEVLARLIPEPLGFAQKMGRFREAALLPDPQLGWRPQPGAEVDVDGIHYRFDALGTRGAEVDAEVPTILVVGDSVTMGWGVAEEDTFAAGLERALCGEGSCRVVNAGVVGYGLAQDLARARELANALHPKLILLGYYPNDPEEAESAPGLGGPAWLRAWTLVRPGIEALLVRAGALPGASEHHRRLHAPGSAGWGRVQETFAALGLLCRSERLPCLVALLPELQARPYALSDVHARLAREAEHAGLSVIDLAPAVADLDPRTLWVAPDDAHPNALGHQRYTRALAPPSARLLSEGAASQAPRSD